MITGEGADAAATQTDERNKLIIFKKSAPSTDCISEINNAQVDNEKGFGVVITMYNLIEHSNNNLKTSRSSLQYCRGEPDTTMKDSETLKLKTKITGRTLADGNTNVAEMAVS